MGIINKEFNRIEKIESTTFKQLELKSVKKISCFDINKFSTP
jgi:hypothetical protein